MSRSIGNHLPQAVRELLAGDDLESREGLTILLLSTTTDGWPHLAMLSVGEIVAVDDRLLRAALWPNSTATANLTHGSRATLALVHQNVAYYVRCVAEREDDVRLPTGNLAGFRLRVVGALQDSAPYANLTSGVTFELKDPSQVYPRWNSTVEALRARA